MKGKETKGKENQLTAKLATKVEKNKKEGELTQTKTKQPKATQANKPQTGGKLLTAKALAEKAGVAPSILRKCLRNHFAGRISTTKGDNGLKTYQIRAKDPIVKEVIAKLKGNGDKPTTAYDKVVKGKAPKAEASPAEIQVETPPEESPTISPPSAEITEDKGEGDEPSPEPPLDCVEAFDKVYGGTNSREKMKRLTVEVK